MNLAPLKDYLRSIEQTALTGGATEHSFRPALKAFIESFGNDLEALNEPKRVKCGAPDFQVFRGSPGVRFNVGYIETKDLGASLDEVERSDQLKRYRGELDNLLLTDYLEFRWFVHGESRKKATLGSFDGKRIIRSKQGEAELLALLDEFISHQTEPIGRASDLALRMAKLTRAIKEIIVEAFKTKEANSRLVQLYESFRAQLIPHLNENQFSDMFAQTLAYGLFAARVQHQSGSFQLFTAVREIPKTMPFLVDLFYVVTGPHFSDELYSGYLEDLTEVLAKADMSLVLADFGKLSRDKDPVLHFYETFLSAYDPAERERRGVYYTPESVVSYIVRSVDEVLKKEFNCADGIADKTKIKVRNTDSHQVLLLDPACGTGSFLYGVVNHIRDRFAEFNNAGEWKDYVVAHLIPRLFGFELLMAPYAVAHFKLGLQLEARHLSPAQQKIWGADLKKASRLNIFLTDALEPMGTKDYTLALGSDFIATETEAAADVKSKFPILVVLGNPPYSGHSASKSEWIRKLIEDYKFVDGVPLGEKNPKWLQDDYVKFIRFGQWRIEQTGQGILAFITNHAYLDNPTFRGMRRKLMRTFDEIYILNLHGNSKKKEKALDGGKDENVFDIQQGVAIAIFVKRPTPPTPPSIEGGENATLSPLLLKGGTEGGLDPATKLNGKTEGGLSIIHYAELFGKRDSKEEYLFSHDIGKTEWKTLSPSSPHYLFIPQDVSLREEYEKGLPINEIFPVNSVGIVTARDSLTIAFTKKELIARVREFLSIEPEQARERFELGKDSSDWKVAWAQKDLRDRKNWENDVVPILYRPFDIRWTVYTGKASGFIVRPRPEVMGKMAKEVNVGLVTVRQIAEEVFNHVLITDLIIDNRITASNKGTGYLYPLHLSSLIPNLSSNLSFRPKELFAYTIAFLHSSNYRERYSVFLRHDYPRIKLTGDEKLFGQLANLGSQLIELHLLKSPLLNDTGVNYPVPGSHLVEKGYPKYTPPSSPPQAVGRVNINKDQYFEGIPPEAWNFHIGGYQVLEKWLKDRRGSSLSADDREHYRKVVKAIVETIRIMKEIDEAIPGWPLP